jgi:16S rRNA (cytosine1407-C5)-methyltransferase
MKLPEDFLSRLKVIYGDNFQDILNTFEVKKPTTFRVNTLKSTEEEVVTQLKSLGFELEKTDINNAFILKNKTQRELTETEIYKQGFIYIQGLSSMIPPIILDPQENELILDMCAAPGSKTTQISALMKNTGQIIANDMSKVRLYKLAANIQTLGVTNIKTIHMRAQDLWKKFPNTFDKVLVDVPCSLEGRFSTNYPKSYSQWSIKKVKILSEHQKHILRSAISCAKPGGIIIYSTCTISPEENEEVIDWILKKEKDIRLESVEISGVKKGDTIRKWEGKEYSQDVSKTLRLTPTDNMEAFFVAKLKKL